MDEKQFRNALSAVIRGAILLVVLTIIRALASKLPGLDTMIFRLNAWGYIYLAISVVIIVVLVQMFSPLKALVGYYLAAAAKIGKVPGREKYLAHVVPLSGTIVFFVYILVVYKYLFPVAVILNEWMIHWREMERALGIAAVVLGIAALVKMWLQASPLIDLFTGKLTETTADATIKLVSVACPACGTQNDRDRKFCASCGASLAAQAVAADLAARACAKCGAQNPTAAKFCGECGQVVA